ncbi:hypothetical protein GCM10009679_01710 [Saccharothrix algeriensis]
MGASPQLGGTQAADAPTDHSPVVPHPRQSCAPNLTRRADSRSTVIDGSAAPHQ